MKTFFRKENRFPLAPTPWNEKALDLAYRRYLYNTDISIENWFSQLAMRVCRQYAGQEKEYYQELYTSLLESKSFLPTSAALANSIKDSSALAGCMVMPLPDCVEELFGKTLPEMMKMLLLGIGIGVDLSHCVPRLLNHKNSISIGPIQNLLTVTQAVQRPALYQGLKPAAFMATLFAQHPDIFEFIALKKEQALPTANISVSVDGVFIAALKDKGLLPLKWQKESSEILRVHHLETMKKNAVRRNLLGPDLHVEATGKVFSRSYGNYVGRVIGDIVFVEAETLLLSIAESAYECGDPGIINLAAINQDNPTHSRYSQEKKPGIGVIKTTTPCGEQALLPYEVCHLGSFNLAFFVKDKKFQEEIFIDTVHIATRFMDDLISMTDIGLDEANLVSRANRKLGLGIMGLADALAELELPYDSEEALLFAKQVGQIFHQACTEASRELAVLRGHYPNFVYSKQKDEEPRRNATLTTIAPTGHIATLAGCFFGIEPYYLMRFDQEGSRSFECIVLDKKLQKIDYSLSKWIDDTKKIFSEFHFDGTLSTLIDNPFNDEEKNNYLKKMKKVFKTAHELSFTAHLNMVFAWQKYIDTGISKTINLPKNTTIENILEIFNQALLLNLKGITVFRDDSFIGAALKKPKENNTRCVIAMDNHYDILCA